MSRFRNQRAKNANPCHFATLFCLLICIGAQGLLQAQWGSCRSVWVTYGEVQDCVLLPMCVVLQGAGLHCTL